MAKAKGGRKKRGKGGKKKDKNNNSSPKNPSDGDDSNAAPPSLFEVGTLVEITDLTPREGYKNTCHPDCFCPYGTIVGHSATYTDGITYSYLIHMECNQYIYLQHTDLFIKERDRRLRFKMGQRVECSMTGGDTLPGIVTELWYKDDTGRSWPYRILLDNSGNTTASFDRDEMIRASKLPPVNLRFRVGDRVCCYMGEGRGWRDGTVHETWCIWKGTLAPYRVLLDCVGNEIYEENITYAPSDRDICLKSSTVPVPSCWICFDNDQREGNLIFRECACRGDGTGHVHTKCLIELARSKLPDEEAFNRCITCKTNFTPGGYCHSALVHEFFQIYHESEDIVQRLHSHNLMSDLLILEGEYERAEAMMQSCITLIRSMIESYEGIALGITRPLYDWLAKFLLELSRVYQATSNLEEMGTVLEEACELTSIPEGGESDLLKQYRRVDVEARSAMHRYLSGDKLGALGCMEESIRLATKIPKYNQVNFANLLYNLGNLNLQCNNRQRGIEQMSESIDIQARIYGSNERIVCNARKSLDEIRKGNLKKATFHNEKDRKTEIVFW